MNIIAKTDIHDNDGILSSVVKLGRRHNNGNWEYVVDLNFKETVYPDLIEALRKFNEAVYEECI